MDMPDDPFGPTIITGSFDEVIKQLTGALNGTAPTNMFGYDSGPLGSVRDGIYTLFEAIVLAIVDTDQVHIHQAMDALPKFYLVARSAGIDEGELMSFVESFIRHAYEEPGSNEMIKAFRQMMS